MTSGDGAGSTRRGTGRPEEPEAGRPLEGFSSLDALLAAALDCPSEGRDDFARQACGHQPALLKQLRELLELARDDGQLSAALPPGGGLQGPTWEALARELGQAEEGLAPGARVGRYEIRGLIGVGGMGRVYRAFNPTLSREVAIKALTPALGQDNPQARRRFEREARMLAALNHPNIAAIHGFELCEDRPYLVLELVEGPTLADRLRQRPLPVPRAIAVARDVALALEEAHRRGVVHRDLKPSNVKIGPKDQVKILDFGIARPVPTDQEDSPWAPAGELTTAVGDILGTAPYMSPEQIRGETTDPRTDIWAFGCLLFEMLSGRAAFAGATRAETLASVLRDEIDWGRLPVTPPAVTRLLRRCLRRDLHRRLQHVGDARIELEELEVEAYSSQPAAGRPARGRRIAGLANVAVALGSLMVLVAGGRPERASPAVAQLGLDLPANLTLARDFAAPFAVAPDGTSLVALAARAGKQSLFLRRMDRLAAIPIPDTEGAWQPFFSPDGREVGFFARRKLMRVSVEGGTPVPVAEVGDHPRGGCWVDDATMVVTPSPGAGLSRVSLDGGRLQALTRLDRARGESSHRWPHVLPGGRWILFTTNVGHGIFDGSRLEVVSLESGERRVLVPDASYGRYGDGRLFFARSGRMFAVRFDPKELRIEGAPEVALDGIRHDPRHGSADFALSEAGTVVYTAAAARSPETQLTWVDEAGRLTRIGDGPRPFLEPRLSPDGRRIAVRIGARSDQADLWIIETENARFFRASLGRPVSRPLWTADSQAVTVTQHDGAGWKLLTLPGTSSGLPSTIFEGPNEVLANAWSSEGRLLLIQELRPDTGWDLRLLEFGADGRPAGEPRDIAVEPYDERNGSISPDGRWVAYEVEDPDGVTDIYVAALADPTSRVRVTTPSGGRWPRWGASNELYCWDSGERPGAPGNMARGGLHRLDWTGESGARASRLAARRQGPVWSQSPDRAALLERLMVTPFASYDVDLSRGKPRFLLLAASGPDAVAPAPSPVVVVNWFAELRARKQPQP